MRAQLRALGAAGKRGRARCVTQTAKLPRGWTLREAVEATRRARPTGFSPRGLGPDPAPAAVPSYCPREFVLSNPNRSQYCSTGLVESTTYQGGSAGVEVIGRSYTLVIDWAELNYKKREWGHAVKVNMLAATGVESAGLSFLAQGRCYGRCAVVGSYPPDTWVLVRPGAPMQGAWVMASPGKAINSVLHNIDLFSFAPGFPTSAAYSPTRLSPATRCDSESYMKVGRTRPAGCVYFGVPGLFALSAAPGSDVELSAKFIRDAQKRLRKNPGRYPDGALLHRTRSTAANRAVSEPECDRRFGTPRPAGMECDEYPFAATREGAATGNYALRLVPREQNRRVGGRLRGDFFIKQRILYRDPFYVYIGG